MEMGMCITEVLGTTLAKYVVQQVQQVQQAQLVLQVLGELLALQALKVKEVFKDYSALQDQ
jgi:hypothetical protein